MLGGVPSKTDTKKISNQDGYKIILNVPKFDTSGGSSPFKFQEDNLIRIKEEQGISLAEETQIW